MSGEGQEKLVQGNPPIGGCIQNGEAKSDAKFYPPFLSPPAHYQNQERLDEFTSKSGEGCSMIRFSRKRLRYPGEVPGNIAVNLSKKIREIRIVWTSLHRYPGLEAIEAEVERWK